MIACVQLCAHAAVWSQRQKWGEAISKLKKNVNVRACVCVIYIPILSCNMQALSKYVTSSK